VSETGARRTLLGDADRERVIALLREHYAAGRFSVDELTRRTEVVLSAEYADDAAQVLADLPGSTAGLPGVTGLPAMAAPGGGDTPGGTPGGLRSGLFRRKGHADASRAQAHWVATSERFRDPSSGAIMRVWIDPSDDSRHYVPDAQP
jgi:Domain of unknown function (DUF1707)